jgi:hypothetical protein
MGYGGKALGANGLCSSHSSCPGLPQHWCGGVRSGTWGETELEVSYALA